MTAIGKMLVFLVLLLNLVWMGMVVNAYATRSNWKKQADDARAELKKAADSAVSLRKLVDAEREASEAEKRVVREDRDRLYAQLAALEAQYKTLNDEVNKKLATEKDSGGNADKLQANLKSLSDQVNALTDRIKEKESEIDKLILQSERDKADKTKADLDAAAQLRRAEDLSDRLQRANEELQDLRQNGGRPSAGALGQRPVAPKDFRGTVRTREGELVAFSPGLDTGLKKDALLTVYRVSGGVGKYLGKIRVLQVDPKEGVGQFLPPAGVRLGADDYPRAGDEVKAD